MSEKLVEPDLQGGMPPLRRVLHVLCSGLAALGGLVIFGAAIFVTLSVIKSNLGMGSFRGEFELVELSCAACASLFLPLCQLNKGHVVVDIFTGGLSYQTNRFIDAAWSILFAAVWAFICWRLLHGLWEIRGYGDKTVMLRASIWWVYVPAVVGTGTSALIAALWGLSAWMPGTIRMEAVR